MAIEETKNATNNNNFKFQNFLLIPRLGGEGGPAGRDRAEKEARNQAIKIKEQKTVKALPEV